MSRENELHVDDFIHFAQNLTGTPYIWAGKTRAGLDCSGLVTFSLRSIGAPPNCPVCGKDWLGFHSAQHMFDEFLPVPLADVKRGNLAFFGADSKHVSHVGILTGGELMLEAGGGDHTCLTPQEAHRRGACVRTAKSWRWKNLQGVRALPMLYP